MERKQHRHYGVFILESALVDQEDEQDLDGYALSSMLDLCGIDNKYRYFRTKAELEYLVDRFDESDFAFLHLACHGNTQGFQFAMDQVTFPELAEVLGRSMRKRRMFLSSCEAACFELAEHFVPRYHTHSVIGTPDTIRVDRAAVFWSAFYHVMFQNDNVSMPQKLLIPTLTRMTRLFEMNVNYFSIIKNSNPRSIDHLRQIRFSNGRKVYDKVEQTQFRNVFREE